MAAQSDPGLPGPMDGAPKKAGFKAAYKQPPRDSVSATGPSDPPIEPNKRRTAPAVKTRGSNRGPR
jgi:hypothetical protein